MYFNILVYFCRRSFLLRGYWITTLSLSLSPSDCVFVVVCLFVCQVIRGAGHYVFADQPNDFNRTVLQILAGTQEKKPR